MLQDHTATWEQREKHISANTTLEGRAGAELPYRQVQRGRSRQTLPWGFTFPYTSLFAPSILAPQVRAGMYFAQNTRMYMLKKGLYILTFLLLVKNQPLLMQTVCWQSMFFFPRFPVLHLRTSAWQHLFFSPRGSLVPISSPSAQITSCWLWNHNSTQQERTFTIQQEKEEIWPEWSHFQAK